MEISFKEEMNPQTIRQNEFEMLSIAIQRAIDLSYKFDTKLKDVTPGDNKAWISLREVESGVLDDEKISILANEFQSRVLDNNEFVDENQMAEDDQYAISTASDDIASKSTTLSFVSSVTDDDDEDEDDDEEDDDDEDEEFDEDDLDDLEE